MTVHFLSNIMRGWKSFEIVGWNNYMIELFSYFRGNDRTFPIVCHAQYLVILLLKIFMVGIYCGPILRSCTMKIWTLDSNYSIMNVRIAGQVLGETVANILLTTGPADTNAIEKLCLMMDRFFDCLNVRNTEEHKVK